MRSLRPICLWALAGLLPPIDAAWGQDALNTRLFTPRPAGSPTLTLDGTDPLGRGGLSVSLWGGVESRPLIFYRDGARTADIVRRRAFLDVSVAAGIADGVDLGVIAPTVLQQSGRQVAHDTPISRFAFGDPTLALKIRLLNKHTLGVGASLVLGGTLPLGDADALAGEGNATAEPRLAIEVPIGPRVDVLLNGGARFREATEVGGISVGHEWVGGLGASWRMTPDLALSAEVTGRTSVAEPLAAVEDSPIGANAAIRLQLWHGLTLTLGGGAGVQAGYGAPAWRGVVGLEAAPRRHDFDGDALADGRDRCIETPGVPDRHGCPAPQIPTTPEAPPAQLVKVGDDPDGDGVLGDADACPFLPEDKDEFLDEDGCPDEDNDLDGIADVDDLAPLAPEDLDGYADTDGAPDPDNDDDGVADVVDACPLERGTGDGCPSEPRPARPAPGGPMLLGDTLHPASPIRFEFARSPLHAESAKLLDELASFLNDRPDWGPVEVGVHTDALGSQVWKRWLSIQRAEHVRAALVARGVPADRLTARGYGPSVPVADNATREGRYRNRRVELRFLDRPVKRRGAEAPSEAAPQTAPADPEASQPVSRNEPEREVH